MIGLLILIVPAVAVCSYYFCAFVKDADYERDMRAKNDIIQSYERENLELQSQVVSLRQKSLFGV